MSQIPADLLEFMETLRVPQGVNPAEMLTKYDELMNGNPPSVGAVHDGVLLREVAGWRLTADIAVPFGAGPHPVLVYFHGGGWTMGSPKTHLRVGREFAAAGYLTINLDYRRAPKHRFPAAFEDCLFATHWAVEHAARYGGDPQRLAVGGDSAGGNLAAAVLAECSQKGGPPIRAGVLIYGLSQDDQRAGRDRAGLAVLPPCESVRGAARGLSRESALRLYQVPIVLYRRWHQGPTPARIAGARQGPHRGRH